jgi:hypothetical protein
MMEPLSISFKGQSYPDSSKIPLGTLIAGLSEQEDKVTYEFDLSNNSINDLEEIELKTNLNTDMYTANYPSQIGAKKNSKLVLQLSASKLFDAPIEKIHIGFKYKEVKRY